MRSTTARLLPLAALLALAACAPRVARPTPDAKEDPADRGGSRAGGHFAEGVASFYGHELAGRPTANGERFAPEGMTAAHRKLRFNTCVRVQNLENGRSVKVRINDRGPYVKGRIIDVSLGAARRLGMLEKGVTRVRLYPCGRRPSV